MRIKLKLEERERRFLLLLCFLKAVFKMRASSETDKREIVAISSVVFLLFYYYYFVDKLSDILL